MTFLQQRPESFRSSPQLRNSAKDVLNWAYGLRRWILSDQSHLRISADSAEIELACGDRSTLGTVISASIYAGHRHYCGDAEMPERIPVLRCGRIGTPLAATPRDNGHLALDSIAQIRPAIRLNGPPPGSFR